MFVVARTKLCAPAAVDNAPQEAVSHVLWLPVLPISQFLFQFSIFSFQFSICSFYFVLFDFLPGVFYLLFALLCLIFYHNFFVFVSFHLLLSVFCFLLCSFFGFGFDFPSSIRIGFSLVFFVFFSCLTELYHISPPRPAAYCINFVSVW